MEKSEGNDKGSSKQPSAAAGAPAPIAPEEAFANAAGKFAVGISGLKREQGEIAEIGKQLAKAQERAEQHRDEAILALNGIQELTQEFAATLRGEKPSASGTESHHGEPEGGMEAALEAAAAQSTPPEEPKKTPQAAVPARTPAPEKKKEPLAKRAWAWLKSRLTPKATVDPDGPIIPSDDDEPKRPVNPSGRKTPILIFLILVASLIGAVMSTCNYVEDHLLKQRQIAALEQQIETLNENLETALADDEADAARIADLEKQVAKLTAERDALKKQVKSFEALWAKIKSACGIKSEPVRKRKCALEDYACFWGTCTDGKQYLTECVKRRKAMCEGGVTLARKKESVKDLFRVCGESAAVPAPPAPPPPVEVPPDEETVRQRDSAQTALVEEEIPPAPERECTEADYSCGWTDWANDRRERVCALKSGTECAGGVTVASLHAVEKREPPPPPAPPPPEPAPAPPPPPVERAQEQPATPVQVASIQASPQPTDVGPYDVVSFGLLPGCRLGLKKGTGIHHVLLVGDKVITEGDGVLKTPVEPGPKYRLKLKHNGGVDVDYSLTFKGNALVRDHDTTTKETNFFFRVSEGCSSIESAL